MNKGKLKQAEQAFFTRYPGGFQDPEMLAIGKKHKMEKMIDFAQTELAKEGFAQTALVSESIHKLITRSSLVSVFEKAKYRDFSKSLSSQENSTLCEAIFELLHGDERTGFEALAGFLYQGKLAKWPLMTICQTYYRPLDAVFVKPTTAKGVIKFFELDIPPYSPTPNWEFYAAYRNAILQMRSQVDEALAPSNAAFCGFLMMALDHQAEPN